MTWEEKLLNKAREVMKHGWGKIEFIVSNNGRRRTYNKTLTEIEEKNLLQKPK